LKKYRSLALSICFLLISPMLTVFPADLRLPVCDFEKPHSCSIYTISCDDTIWYSNDEMGKDMSAFLWGRPRQGSPPGQGKYAALCWGREYWDYGSFILLGGINEKGLCADACAVDWHPVFVDSLKTTFKDVLAVDLRTAMLDYCATVDEAVDLAMSYNWPGDHLGEQIHIADADGNAAVISCGETIPDPAGQPDARLLEVTFKNANHPNDPTFLVSTNWNLNIADEHDPDCWRYNILTSRLQLAEEEADLTLANVINTTTAAFATRSIYQCLIDPLRMKLHLCFYMQWDGMVEIDVADLLDNTTNFWFMRMCDYFSEETVQAGLSASQSDPALTDIDWYYDDYLTTVPDPPDLSGVSLAYETDFLPGPTPSDPNGTSIEQLVAHDGRLFASTGMWNSSKPNPACQVLVKKSYNGSWEVDKQFSTDNLGILDMQSVTFSTDGDGSPVASVTLLLVAPEDKTGGAVIYSRDDVSGAWTAMEVENTPYSTSNGCAAIGFHRDMVTGVDFVFVGTSQGKAIYSGVYDPDEMGCIAWAGSPEFTTPMEEDVTGFAVCNDVLFVSTFSRIYRRTDGPLPDWVEVFDYDDIRTAPVNSNYLGLQGLTAVPDPGGRGQVLLFSIAQDLYRVDPQAGYEAKLELPLSIAIMLDSQDTLAGACGAGANAFVPYSLPGSQRTHWLGGFIYTYKPYFATTNEEDPFFLFDNGAPPYFAAEGKFFVRTENGGYAIREIHDPNVTPKQKLVFPQAIAVSPFAQDNGKVIYFGGFNTMGIKVDEYTAWIYKMTITGDTTPAQEEASPALPGIRLNCYPNPCNPSTQVRLLIPEANLLPEVDLAVYDLSGRRVVTLFTGRLTGGARHEFTWNGNDDHGHEQSSGVYFIRADVAGISSTRKLMMLR